jgi:ParB-like chromosome segregation protein Spo0J
VSYTIHPLCKLLPPLADEEFDLLVESIKEHNGLLEPISLSDEGFNGHKDRILDGANRYRAMKKLGMSVRKDIDTRYVRKPDGNLIRDDDDAAIVTFIINKNFRRRHLSAEKQRELIEELIKADPTRSDRQIAKETGKSPTTVGKIRTNMEEAGDVSTVDTRTDTRGRKQPARKTKPALRDADFAVLTRAALGHDPPAAAGSGNADGVQAHVDAINELLPKLEAEQKKMAAYEAVAAVVAALEITNNMGAKIQGMLEKEPDQLTDGMIGVCRMIAKAWADLVEQFEQMRQARGNDVDEAVTG